MKKKLKVPTCHNPMAIEVAQVGIEKEKIFQALLAKEEEMSKLKDTDEMLQKNIDYHVCTVVIP